MVEDGILSINKKKKVKKNLNTLCELSQKKKTKTKNISLTLNNM